MSSEPNDGSTATAPHEAEMSSNEGESKVGAEKETKPKCCCHWKDCADLSAKIASSNDESVQLWKGNIVHDYW